jgi:hypothetical protein
MPDILGPPPNDFPVLDQTGRLSTVWKQWVSKLRNVIGTDGGTYQLVSEKNAANGYPGIGSSQLSTSRAVATDGSRELVTVATTATELGYVNGVTSPVQTQLDAKLASASYTAADVLTKLLTVDGSGSGLDADLVDGKNPGSANGLATLGADSALNEYADLFKTVDGTAFYIKKVDIGDWDLDGTSVVSITHGVDLAKNPFPIGGWIRDDAAAVHHPIPSRNTAGSGDVDFRSVDVTNGITSTTIDLIRATGGTFDNVRYNATSFNRGEVYLLVRV